MSAAPSHEMSAALVQTILAEQLDALHEHIKGAVLVDRLAGCADQLAALAALLEPGSGAARAAATLETTLDDLAFDHAQQQDLARQTAELVAKALRMFGAGALSPDGLWALYVSDAQRRLHETLLERLTQGAKKL
jgi:hypothetical protein